MSYGATVSHPSNPHNGGDGSVKAEGSRGENDGQPRNVSAVNFGYDMTSNSGR